VTAAAEASGDHNPLHTDPASARAAGLAAAPAHGMLSMADLGRLSVRFTAPTPVGSAPAFTSTARSGQDGEILVQLEGRLEDGTVTVQGRAVLRPRR
jgi:acyl dehydratase